MDKIVYFDMDGTLADLYGVTNVFKRLDTLDDDVRVLNNWNYDRIQAVNNKAIK